ncbi:very short patch repair endonuclease [Mucilaginibacter limnophilus]|uniref:Very short patch repair endonuclease n=1 Tax=Mucilaginibacter limnophilus TaxID=1932778 RepID=A0A3S2UPK3_9SPHI|nr:very short patch repair endonuclease [Mucilaginibacter limnophilus]RVU01264.1 very short patch repair endonuclease [Mucilaginibacter limnophilus]
MKPSNEPLIIKVPRFEAKNGFSTSETRSRLMSKIKNKNTKPEIALRKALWALGIRYRIHNKKLPGNPDLVMQRHKLVVFVDGEFWHGYEWEKKRTKIKANREFWIAKIERNMQRDMENNAKLNQLGYKVLRFWEKDISKNLTETLCKITSFIDPSI